MADDNQTLKILDIDLDFFLNNKHTGTVTSSTRLDDSFVPWIETDAIDFLENNCGLNRDKRIPEKVFTHHVEAFYFMRNLQEKSNYKYDFIIDHVDAHGDLGTGDASYKYIATDVLNLRLQERAYPEKTNGWEGLSSGNFLAFAIACRWVKSLNYVNDIEETDDCQIFNLFNWENPNQGIQLRQFSHQQMDEIIYCSGGNMVEFSHTLTPMSVEPIVPFQVTDFPGFKSSGNYDHVSLTQSPGFTPITSDRLFPIIAAYMEL